MNRFYFLIKKFKTFLKKYTKFLSCLMFLNFCLKEIKFEFDLIRKYFIYFVHVNSA